MTLADGLVAVAQDHRSYPRWNKLSRRGPPVS
jgi:hypothetical protein